MLKEKPPVPERTHIDYNETKKIILEIDQLFRAKSIPRNNFYVLPFELKESLIFDNKIVQILQKLSNNMCLFLGLFNKPLIIYIEEGVEKYNNLNRVFCCDGDGTIRSFEKEKDYAGLYENKLGPKQIQIVKKKGYKIIHLVGILAHEITHHFLDYHGIYKNNVMENEIFTDLASVYLGFGHLLHPAYKIITFNTDWVDREDKSYSYTTHSRTIGYVTTETILNALAITAEVKNWKPKLVIKSISSGDDRANVAAKLLRYRISLLKIKIKTLYENIKSKRHKEIYLKLMNSLNKLKLNYDEIKRTLYSLSIIDSKSITKKDSELLVILSGEIFLSDIDNQIESKIKYLTELNSKGIRVNRKVYLSVRKIEYQIHHWDKKLNKLKKIYT